MSTRLYLAPLDRTATVPWVALSGVWNAAYRQEAEVLGIEVSRFPPLQRSPADWLQAGTDFLGAWAAGALLGAAEHRWAADQDCRWIDALVVDPAHQRRGIGTALMLGLLRAYAHQRFRLSTALDNGPAMALYTGLGFRPGESRAVDGPLKVLTLERPAMASLIDTDSP